MNKEYKLNMGLSKELYEREDIKGLVKIKECYYNMFQVTSFSNLRREFHDKKYRIAMCYVNVAFGIWIRHCVLLNENDEIIDLTMFASGREPSENREYKIFKILDSENYGKELELDEGKDGYRCDIPYRKEELEFYKREKEADMFFQVNEYDFFEYIVPMLRKEKEMIS